MIDECERVTILIVDDEEVIRFNLCGYLEDEGFIVVSAGSAEEALEVLHATPVRVAVVDIRLPGIDGNAFIMKAHALFADMKFVIYTGSSDYVLPKELVEIGLTEDIIIQKPVVNMDVLALAIKKALTID